MFLDDLRIVDYSEGRAVVGVEFLHASAGIDLSDVPFASTVERLIGECGHSFRVFAQQSRRGGAVDASRRRADTGFAMSTNAARLRPDAFRARARIPARALPLVLVLR